LFVAALVVFRAIQRDSTSIPPNSTVWAGLIGLAVISTVIPIFTFHAGMHRLGAPRAAIISMIEPVLTLLWAVIIRHESLQPIQLIGSFFILMSVVVLQLRRESPLVEILVEDSPPIVG
jgi:drug/metabolite transporter (DMT)-like permease